MNLVKKALPQNPEIEVFVPNYKEPILAVNHGGFGWYGLQAYNEQDQLMCHECGGFYDFLGTHIHRHNLNPQQYRKKYGLRGRTKLVSATLQGTFSLIAQNRPDYKERMEKFVAYSRSGGKHRKHHPISLEQRNIQDSCPSQLLRRLKDAAEIYGDNVSANQARGFDSGLVYLLRTHYGSFNKAKQLVRLVANSIHGDKQFTKALISEDMCCFYNKNGRWPSNRDYRDRLMICQLRTLGYHGGMKALRQEAMELKEEQEVSAKQAERIPQIAASIEMQYAGTARR